MLPFFSVSTPRIDYKSVLFSGCLQHLQSSVISKIPRRKAIPTCWSTNGASIKEFRVRNKGQCAPLTRSLSACTHFKKLEMPPRMGNFPTDSGLKDCGPQTATIPAKAKISRGRKGKEARTQRDALPVTGSVEHLEMFGSSQYQQTNARARDCNRLLPCLQEFLLSQAEDLCVCRPSSSNRLPAMFGFTGRRKARDRPRDGCRRLPKSSQLVLTRPASVERRGKAQILRLPVDPELLL